jgi:hypothetical protein
MKFGVMYSLGGDDQSAEKLARRKRIDINNRWKAHTKATEAERHAMLDDVLNYCRQHDNIDHLIISIPGLKKEISNEPYSSGLGDFLDSKEQPKTLQNYSGSVYLPTYSSGSPSISLSYEEKEKIKRILQSHNITVYFA